MQEGCPLGSLGPGSSFLESYLSSRQTVLVLTRVSFT